MSKHNNNKKLIDNSPFKLILDYADEITKTPLEKQTDILERVFEIVGNDILASDIYSSTTPGDDDVTWFLLSDYLQWIDTQFDIYSGEFHASHVEFSKLLYRYFAIICCASDMMMTGQQHHDNVEQEEGEEEVMTENDWNEMVNELKRNWIESRERGARYGAIATYMLGVYYKEMSSFFEQTIQLAIETLETCVRKYPRLMGAYLKLLEIQEGLSLYQENVTLATEALSVMDDSPFGRQLTHMRCIVLKHRALAHFKLGDSEEGMRDYEASNQVDNQQLLKSSTQQQQQQRPSMAQVEEKERFEQKLESYVLKAATV